MLVLVVIPHFFIPQSLLYLETTTIRNAPILTVAIVVNYKEQNKGHTHAHTENVYCPKIDKEHVR